MTTLHDGVFDISNWDTAVANWDTAVAESNVKFDPAMTGALTLPANPTRAQVAQDTAVAVLKSYLDGLPAGPLPLAGGTCVNVRPYSAAKPVARKAVTPANKPADPAFHNALRPRRLQIGLRYLGD